MGGRLTAASLQDRVALVTGGSSGIGRASAMLFASEGAKVVVADLDESGGSKTAESIREMGSTAIFAKTDVRNASDVQRLIEFTVANFGRLDCAFNNAGVVGRVTSTTDCSEENWDRIIDTNLKGVWLCVKYEIPQMLKQGRGAIVNVSSVSGLVGLKGETERSG